LKPLSFATLPHLSKPAVRVAAAAVLFVAAAGAGAQSPAQWPAKPIRLIVAVQPGGNLDLMGRAVAQKIAEGLGRPVVVENRPGANSMIGAEFVARSAPDGYTLQMAAQSLLVAPLMMRAPPVDPTRDFAGVSLIATLPQMLVVHPSVPAKSVRELIALAKARPGELNCSTSGNGSGSHLALELFRRQSGVQVARIPYNGDAQAIVQLLGGQVSFKFDNLTTSIPHVQSGRLRVLGVTTPKRTDLLPGVPAIAETLPGFEASIWNGMVAPAATPPEIIARLHGEILKFTQAPEIRTRFAQQGVELHGTRSPEQFTAYLKSEYARYGKLIREAGLTQE
jgi:tripartite-type tricarboxylate transporter receptor subunit TctC